MGIKLEDTPEQKVRNELTPILATIDMIKSGYDIDATLLSLIDLSEKAAVRLIAASMSWEKA